MTARRLVGATLALAAGVAAACGGFITDDNWATGGKVRVVPLDTP